MNIHKHIVTLTFTIASEVSKIFPCLHLKKLKLRDFYESFLKYIGFKPG